MSTNPSFSHKVKEFTEVAFKVPNTPKSFDRKALAFLTIKVMTELAEMHSTWTNKPYEFLQECLHSAEEEQRVVEDLAETEQENIARIADAAGDICYFIQNAMCKNGVNLDAVLEVIHTGNMDKKFPDGSFRLDATGKVVKPPGFRHPDISKEIERQNREGSW
jgi:predicted HAD superfamily Cof-like phosphohydrolase